MSSPSVVNTQHDYRRRLERLLEVTHRLTSTLELPSLLKTLIEAAVELTNTEAASILLFDPNRGQLKFEATTNTTIVNMEEILVPLEGSVAGSIFTTRQPLMITDATKDPRHFRKVDLQTSFLTRSILGVPLMSKDKAIGVLQTLNKRGEHPFDEDDLAIMESLAAQASVAIVNARLFQQSDLIAEMVHELRTPLSALTATSQLLLRTDLPPNRRAEFIATIQDETSRLTQMTTEFLDLARLESGRTKFERRPFNLAGLVNECIAVVQPQAAGRNVVMSSQTSNLPEVLGDRGKIKQVILNLLTNAIKYNRESGTIELVGQQQGRYVRLDVRDTGPGIAPESLTRVFEKFYRVPDSEGMIQGTGLGLAIAKRIVEGQGGKITVDSTVNVGTTFSFTVPLAL